MFCFVRDGIAYAGQAPFTPVPDPLPLHATCGPGRFGRTWTVRLVPDFEGELEPSL